MVSGEMKRTPSAGCMRASAFTLSRSSRYRSGPTSIAMPDGGTRVKQVMRSARPSRRRRDGARIEAATGRDGDVRRVSDRRCDGLIEQLARPLDIVFLAAKG